MRPEVTLIGLLAAALLTASLGAASAPMQCAKAREDVDKIICARPALLARDSAISARLDALKQQCPALRQELVQGQKFWLRERWDCRNLEGAFSSPDVLPACLNQRMAARLQRLDEVSACELGPLRASYRLVDVAYLRQYSALYVGKTVAVFGIMLLDSCTAPAGSPAASATTASVQDTGAGHARLRVQFRSMPPEQRDFLCAQSPASHWRGEVLHDGVGDYLYLTDVLGDPLPPE